MFKLIIHLTCFEEEEIYAENTLYELRALLIPYGKWHINATITKSLTHPESPTPLGEKDTVLPSYRKE